MKKTDSALLNELIGMHIPAQEFQSTLNRMFRSVSSKKLWSNEGDFSSWYANGMQYRKHNFVCAPTSHTARHYFCLTLNRSDDYVDIVDGFLTSV